MALTAQQLADIEEAKKSVAKLEKLKQAGFGNTEFTQIPQTELKKAGFTLPEASELQQKSLPSSLPSLPPVQSSQDAVSDFTNLSVALQEAVAKARQQRQDKTLDFLGGVIPPGAVPASSFASVVSAFNASSAPVESALVGGALDFAQNERDRELALFEQQQAIQRQEQNSIRDLALQLSGQGLKTETINAILTAPNIETAISMSNAALNATAKNNEQFEIREVSRPGGGESLVKVKSDGTIEEVFTAPSSRVGGGGSTDLSLGGGSGVTGNTGFDTARKFVSDNPQASNEELKVELLARRESLGLSITDVNSIISERKQQQESQLSEGDLNAYALGLVKNFFAPQSSFFQSKGTEDQIAFDNAKGQAFDAIRNNGKVNIKGRGEITLTTEQKQQLLNAINKLSLDQVR